MKQRIEVSQLQDLSPEQQDKLRAWWTPQEGDWIYHNWTTDCYSISRGKHTEWHWHIGVIFDSRLDDKEGPIAIYKILEGTAYYSGRGGFRLGDTGVCLLPSVGQLIQLLQEKDGLDTCVYLDGSSIVEDNNICDKLFRAVKEIL